jgi:hypothetical protein
MNYQIQKSVYPTFVQHLFNAVQYHSINFYCLNLSVTTVNVEILNEFIE